MSTNNPNAPSGGATASGADVTKPTSQPTMPTVWPGNAYPLGATYDGAGTNFSLFSEIAERVDLCLIDERGSESRIPLDEVDGYVWHAYLPNITPGQRYGFRVARAVRPGGRSPVRPEQAAARPVREIIRRRLHFRPGAVLLRLRRRRPQGRHVDHRHSPDGRLAGPHHDQRGDQSLLRLGVRPCTTHPVPRDSHLRSARQGPDTDPSRRPRRTSGHLRRPGPPGDHRTPQVAQRHRARIDAGAPVPARRAATGSGPAKLLGLQHIWVLRTALPVLVEPTGRRRGGRVQDDGAQPARGGHRGHSRRRLQPHRRRQPPGPDDQLPRHRQQGLLPARRRGPAAATRTSPAPATASTPATHMCCS